ncbi:MAG: glucokinase [Alphaproteobacteria bacterium]|nr:glucokinase [Alphaproteobacteria bacterium]
MVAPAVAPDLVADIGGTNVRFGLSDGSGHISDVRSLKCVDFAGIAEAVTAYLEEIAPTAPPLSGCFSVACPVQGDQITLTNSPWQFSTEATRRLLGFERLDVINDFAAQALSLPHLTPGDMTQIGEGAPAPGAAMAAIGPGTGLGVSGLVPHAGSWSVVSGEGGHVTWAPADDREREIHHALCQQYPHVSAERILSGSGLELLYQTLCQLRGEAGPRLESAAIMKHATLGDSRIAIEAMAVFFGSLGSVAGDLALTLGAHGGVYICGGIAARHVPLLAASTFRARFVSKGRFADYLAEVPTYVVTNGESGLIGAAASLVANARENDND